MPILQRLYSHKAVDETAIRVHHYITEEYTFEIKGALSPIKGALSPM